MRRNYDSSLIINNYVNARISGYDNNRYLKILIDINSYHVILKIENNFFRFYNIDLDKSHSN